MNRIGRIFLATVAGALSISLVGAAASGRPEGRFDDYAQPRRGGVISTAPLDVRSMGETDALRRNWDGFRGRHGGHWSVYVDERTAMPTLATGSGIRWVATTDLPVITLDALETAVRGFVSREAAVLGDAGRFLALDRDGSAELRPGYWKLVFRQQVDGIEVENARLEFHVDRGKLTMFGASNWGVPPTDVEATVGPDEARAILDGYLDNASVALDLDGDPSLHLLAVDADRDADGPRRWAGPRGAGLDHVLVWRVTLRDPEGPARWVGEIDARDGAVLALYDGAHYAAVRGGVFPENPSGDCAAGGCELDDFPMPYADWTEAGQSEARTDAYGNFTCSDPDATFETTLRGKHVVVQDSCGPISETARCDGAVRLGVNSGQDCDVDPFGSPGNTAAARTSYYHVTRAAEVAKFYNPGNAWLDGPVTVRSNWQVQCNASYAGGAIYVYKTTSICANTGEVSGIAVHEFGHGLDENDGGGWDNTSEAYADMLAMFASRDACFGPGMFTDGRTCAGYGDPCLTCTGFRTFDYEERQSGTPATPQGFVQDHCSVGSNAGPCGGEVHCEAYPINEAMFDFATRDLPAAGLDPDTAWQTAERLWFSSRTGSGGDIYTCALPSSDSCAAGSWYQQLRVADDDDADLSNGTPHAAALYAAFARHNLACGAASDPENENTSSCPSLAAPVVTLSAVAAGTEVAWTATPGASEYLVYRGDLGCDMQLVPVATVPGGTTSWLDTVGDPDVTRHYRVDAVGSNPVCRSAVSNCETTPIGPRLQKNAHRLVESGPHVNGNGRLDPGETVELPITLFNGGLADATGVTARLRTIDPAQGRAVVPVAGYPDIPVDAEFESSLPHVELTLFEDGVACGETVPLELEMVADGVPVRLANIDFTLGESDRMFDKSESLPLTRFLTDPVISTLDVTDDTVIGDLDIAVNITHTVPADLIVELSSPGGTTVRLHDLSPGTGGGIFTRYDLDTEPDGPGAMTDFDGESLAGTWTLSVQNTVFGGGSGSVGGWSLFVTSTGAFGCSEYACAEPAPVEPAAAVLVDKIVDGGDGSVDLAFSWDAVAGVTDYHVLQSTAPAFDAAVDLTGRATGATTLTVEDGAVSTPDLAFFQVRAVNSCNQEGP